jgi:uncharacterized protein YndB with AHSA1/START domain
MAPRADPIVWRLHVPTPPERVFDALATDDGRASFWAESAVEHEGLVDFMFSNGMRLQGRILERTRPTRFSVEYFGGPVHFDLASDGAGGTDIVLIHEGVPEWEWVDTSAGWISVLMALKAAIGFDVDLRNHDPTRCWDGGYVDN